MTTQSVFLRLGMHTVISFIALLAIDIVYTSFLSRLVLGFPKTKVSHTYLGKSYSKDQAHAANLRKHQRDCA